MQLRYRLALPLAAICCLAFAVAPALAAKPAPTPITQADGSTQPPVAEITSSAAACALGTFGPPINAFGYILPPGDEYYTLIDPRQCPTCPPSGYHVTLSHQLLYFTDPCQMQVTVSIVPAFENTPGCFTPNPFAPPLCQPVTYQINDGGVLGQCVDYQLPISAGCCITGPVFLLIEFDSGTCAPGRPAFCGPAACVNCFQYNYYPGAPFPGDDVCAVLSPQGVYGTIMSVDTECCAATPTLPGSWGMLKTLYR